MIWLEPTRKAGKLLAGASLMMGMWMGPVSSALAVERPCPPHNYRCPPGYATPSAPYYSPSPSSPSQTPTPARPGDESPSDAPRDGQPQADNNAQQPNNQQPNNQQPQQDFTPTQDSARANQSPGMNTPQLGRLDHANRLNLFDNMAALPQNRIWFGLQYSSGINTGLAPSHDVIAGFGGDVLAAQGFLEGVYGTSGLFAQQKQLNYRAGAEVLLDQHTSFAVQGQYYTNATDSDAFDSDWSNPQFMIKHVLARDCDTIVSATLGMTAQTGIEQGDFDENTTKFYPGMLYYETLSSDLFTQGGFQFGLPVREDQIYTFDWSVSLGYWLYRDCSLTTGRCCCNQGQITGIIPQINLLGKHTIGDATRNNAFGYDTFLYGITPLLVANEPEHVLDLSVGTLIMVGCDVQVGVGYSFPITDDETRENEFLSYVNYLF